MRVHFGEKFEKALVFASHVHDGQKREGTETPYITHLLAVAAIVGENGGGEDEVVAALLHDAIEDTQETRETLAARSGERVAGVVAECSDAASFPKPPREERKRTYIERVRRASPPARPVSAADKLHNARAILSGYRLAGDDLWGRFEGGPGSSPLVAELDRVVTELERLAGV